MLENREMETTHKTLTAVRKFMTRVYSPFYLESLHLAQFLTGPVVQNISTDSKLERQCLRNWTLFQQNKYVVPTKWNIVPTEEKLFQQNKYIVPTNGSFFVLEQLFVCWTIFLFVGTNFHFGNIEVPILSQLIYFERLGQLREYALLMYML
jgi:hypothetical protein